MHDTSPECRIAGECFAGRVRILNRAVTAIYDEVLRPHKVRISQMNILVAVAAVGPVRATDLCRHLHLEKSTLSRDLDRLTERKLIRVTPTDGRAQNLEATATGRALIKKVMPAWEVAQERVREIIGPELAKGLFDAVERFRKADSDGSR